MNNNLKKYLKMINYEEPGLGILYSPFESGSVGGFEFQLKFFGIILSSALIASSQFMIFPVYVAILPIIDVNVAFAPFSPSLIYPPLLKFLKSLLCSIW